MAAILLAAGLVPCANADGDSDLRGLVTAVGPAPLTFLINGTTITTTLNTDFDSDYAGFSSYADVQFGMQIEARGVTASDGSMLAERVKWREIGSGSNGGGTNRLRGLITSIDLSSSTLTVNGLSILVTPYTGAYDDDDDEHGDDHDRSIKSGDDDDSTETLIDLSTLTVGMAVKVGGTPLPSGQILAGKIEIEDDDIDDDHGGDDDGGHHGGHLVFNLKFRGQIAFITTETQTMNINGKTVLTNELTRFEDANENKIPFSAFFAGQFVEVKANQAPDGSILAVKIEASARESLEFEFKGVLEGVDYVQKAIVINGHNILTTSVTLILNRFNAPIPFEDLQAGQFVEVEGRNFSDGQFYAKKIKLEDDDDDDIPVDEVELRGAIQTLDVPGNRLTVHGRTILVTTGTVILGLARQAITLGELQVGQIVEVEGRPGLERGTVVARKIKREDSLGHDDTDDAIISGSVHPDSTTQHELDDEDDDEDEDENEDEDDDNSGPGRGGDKATIAVIKVGSWLVEVSPSTLLTDRFGEPVSLANIQLGDFAIVSGTPLPGGHIAATSIQREDQFFIPRLTQADVRSERWMSYE